MTRIMDWGAELDAGLSRALRRAAAEGLIEMPPPARVTELWGDAAAMSEHVYFTSLDNGPEAFALLGARMEQADGVARAVVRRVKRGQRGRSGWPTAT